MRRIGMLRAGMLSGVMLVAGALTSWAAEDGFSYRDKKGEYLDVLRDGRVAARYMYGYDKSTPETLHETYKPYLHVFDPAGKAPITKGSGGQFTHHRGIFVGWNKLGFNGKIYDRWHMKGGEQIHQEFTEQKSNRRGATFTSLINWNDEASKPILEEKRTMAIRSGRKLGYALVDLTTELKAVRGDVKLDGDPEHAGAQFRPSDAVIRAQTAYVFPKKNADPKKDRDYPWVGETFALPTGAYSVVHMNHPDNPKETIYSAYRDYGRFGAFFKGEIKSGETLTLRYRFLISEGDLPSAAAIQRQWDAFAKVNSPSPVPELTVAGGVLKGSAKKKNKK